MSMISTEERPLAVKQGDRLAVPWATVVSLAVVLSFADGFWMTSLRGAVGAIERTQSPFTSWLRESTLVLPVFLFAVLGALTLGLRLFGPVLRRPRTVLATALLVVVAGTLAGLAETVASAVYDYHLQTNQLRMMDAMHAICTNSCLAQAQQSTLALQVRGVLYISRWLVLTNLVLVGWMVALRGGVLKVSTTRRRAARDEEDSFLQPASPHRMWLILLAAVAVTIIGLTWFDDVNLSTPTGQSVSTSVR
jgi:hypothetical protein